MNDGKPAMADDTRDRVIEASTEIRQIKDMLREHISETRDHREGLKQEVESIKGRLEAHNNLIQQIKGAKYAVSMIAAAVTTLGVGAVAKIAGLIR